MRSEQENTDSNNYAPSPRIKNALLNSSRTLGCRLSEFKKIDSRQHGQTYWANFIWQIDEQLRLDLIYEAHQAYLKQTFNEQPENISLRWDKEAPALQFSDGICHLTETEFQKLVQLFDLQAPFIKKAPLSWKRAVYNFLKIKVSLIPQWINDKPWYGWKGGLATAVVLVLVVGLFVLLPASEKKPLELAETYNNQVIQYYQEGQFQQAQPLAEKAFKIRKDILGEKHPETLVSLNNLASIYTELGRFSEALPLFEKTYFLQNEVLGEKHPDTLTSLNNLASIYQELGRFSEALPLFEQAYSLQKEMLGEKHPGTLTNLNNLASIYQELDPFSQALPLTYSLQKEVLGEKHPDELASLNNLAGIYQKLDRLDDALPLYEKTYFLSKEMLGEKHPDTLASLNNLAGIYQKLSRLDDALPLYEKSYRLSAKKANEMEEKLRHFQFPWKEANHLLGLNANKQPSPATQAFGAGLWISKEALLGHREAALPEPLLPPAPFDHWSKTDWQDYFELGRWIFLLWTASQFQPAEPKIFWDKQKDIFAQLKGAFEARKAEGDNKAKNVVSQLSNFVEPPLEKLPISDDSKMIRRDLATDLKNIMRIIAPQSLE